MKFFEQFPNKSINEKYFGIFGIPCKTNCYFEYRIRILCIFLYMGTYFKLIFDIFRRRRRRRVPSSSSSSSSVRPSVPSSVPSSSSVLCPSVPSSVQIQTFKKIKQNRLLKQTKITFQLFWGFRKEKSFFCYFWFKLKAGMVFFE